MTEPFQSISGGNTTSPTPVSLSPEERMINDYRKTVAALADARKLRDETEQQIRDLVDKERRQRKIVRAIDPEALEA